MISHNLLVCWTHAFARCRGGAKNDALRRIRTSKIIQDRLLRSRLGGLGILGILLDDGG